MKKYIILVLIALLIGALMVGCTTVTPEIDLSRKPGGPAGNSNIAHLYLYEKTPSGEWPIVEDGAWGKMKYNLSGEEFEFVFNGHDLEVGEEYTLIYYPDPWPGNGLICLGSDIADDEGNVHIADSKDTGGDLPFETDKNADASTTTYGDGSTGAKIWLVLSSDVNCGNGDSQMTGWTPTEYLFEYDLITFTQDQQSLELNGKQTSKTDP